MKYASSFFVTGYVVQGSNGEYVHLSHDERIQMIKFVRNKTDRLILAGSGCEGNMHSFLTRINTFLNFFSSLFN